VEGGLQKLVFIFIFMLTFICDLLIVNLKSYWEASPKNLCILPDKNPL
jgi:hypothetical protein